MTRRTTNTTIRLTEEELEAIKRNADSNHLSVSAFMRKLALENGK